MDRLSALPDRASALCDDLASARIDLSAFLEACTRLVAADIGCARAGVWQFVDIAGGQQVLRCLAMYDVESDRMVAVPDSQDVGAYFLALTQTGYVNACDASSHFATAGLFAQRLSTRRIRSLLAASLTSNGLVHGAVTCTETDREMEWSVRQVSALRRLAGPVAQALFGPPVDGGAPPAPHA